MSSRSKYEFSRATKIKALKESGFRCDLCGISKHDTQDGYLEIHHKIKIETYLKHRSFFNAMGIDDKFMTSVLNAQPLCIEGHQELHRCESFEYYVDVAQSLLEQKGTQLPLAFIWDLAED